MDSVIYRQIIGQINKSSTVPHCNFPSHNLLSMGILARISRDLNDPQYEANDENEFLSEIPCFQPFDYEIENCYPIYCSEGTVDVASSIIKRKIKWERKLKSIKIPDIKKG